MSGKCYLLDLYLCCFGSSEVVLAETTNKFIDNYYWLILSCSDILNGTFASLLCFHQLEKTHCLHTRCTHNVQRITLVWIQMLFVLHLLARVFHVKVTCLAERQGHLEETGGHHCCWGGNANRVISASLLLLHWSWALKPACKQLREAQIDSSPSETWQTSSGWWEY